MTDIHFILYEFYNEFTQIQGKNDREIGKNHREFLTALVAGNHAHEKALYYLSKSKEKRQKRQIAGSKGAEKRWQNDSNANGNANGNANSNANGNANGNGLALEEKRIEENRREEKKKIKKIEDDDPELIRQAEEALRKLERGEFPK